VSKNLICPRRGWVLAAAPRRDCRECRVWRGRDEECSETLNETSLSWKDYVFNLHKCDTLVDTVRYPYTKRDSPASCSLRFEAQRESASCPGYSIRGALYRIFSLDLYVTFHPSCVLLRNSAHGLTLSRIGAIAVRLAPSDGLPAR